MMAEYCVICSAIRMTAIFFSGVIMMLLSYLCGLDAASKLMYWASSSATAREELPKNFVSHNALQYFWSSLV